MSNIVLCVFVSLFFTGCAIVPSYEATPASYCKRESYTTICSGRVESYQRNESINFIRENAWSNEN